MNITLNTNNFNSQYYKNNNPYTANTPKSNGMAYNQPSFKGFDAPTSSKFLSPFKKGMDTVSEKIAKYYTSKVYESKLAKFLAGHTESLSSVVDHMQVLGSVIISGMYMLLTLKNSKFDDEDAKKTLVINQGLTFGASTLGSYLIDGGLNEIWNGFTMKYAIKRTGAKDLPKKLAEFKEKCKAEGKLKSGLIEYLKDEKSAHFNPDLANKVNGMGILKKLVVFGTVYRFLAPVAVTPFANMIGNAIAKKNQAKAAEQQGNVKQDTQQKEVKQAA